MPELKVKVLFFAKSRELAGTKEAEVAIEEGETSRSLLAKLKARYPALEGLKGCFVLAVNQEYVGLEEEKALKAGDEVAIIPPISGG